MTKTANREVAFLSKSPDTTGDGDIRWIGFKASSITGEEKEFWWWRNYSDSLENLKAFCGALLSQRLIEAQVGPAVDLHESLAAKSKVHIIPETDKGKPVYGVYIESKHRPMFNFMLAMEGLKMPKNVKEGWAR